MQGQWSGTPKRRRDQVTGSRPSALELTEGGEDEESTCDAAANDRTKMPDQSQAKRRDAKSVVDKKMIRKRDAVFGQRSENETNNEATDEGNRDCH